MSQCEIGPAEITYAKGQVKQIKKIACGNLPWERYFLKESQDENFEGGIGSKMVENLLAIKDNDKETGPKHYIAIRSLLTWVYAAVFNAMDEKLPSMNVLELLKLEAHYLDAEDADECTNRLKDDVRADLSSLNKYWSDHFFQILNKYPDLEWHDSLFLLIHVRLLLNKLQEPKHRPGMEGIIVLMRALSSSRSEGGKTRQVRAPGPTADPENSKIREPRVTFNDLGGYEQVKDKLLRLAKRVANPSAGKRWGSKPLKAVLLKGPKGTGKSAMAEAFAYEAGLKFMGLSIADTLGMYVNWSVSFLKKNFEEAKAVGGVVLFFDEADAILGQRGQTNHREDDKVVNEFNIQVDRLTRDDRVIVLLATNFSKGLDEAAIRDKRVDMVIEMNLPDDRERGEIFKAIILRVELAVGVSVFASHIVLDTLIQRTKGLPGAALENIIDRALWRKENDELDGNKPGLVTERDLLIALHERLTERPEKKSMMGFRTQVPSDEGGLEELLEET